MTTEQIYEAIHAILQQYRLDFPHYSVPRNVWNEVIKLYASTGLYPDPSDCLMPPRAWALYDPIDDLPILRSL